MTETLMDSPLDYVQWYYDKDHYRWEHFPEVTAFIDSFLREVDAESVLNPGCGPQFYDYMLRFKSAPKKYVGVDISESTVSYLNSARDQRFVQAKSAALESGATAQILCADIFDLAPQFIGGFDAVVASGFIGTFHGEQLTRLCQILHDALKPGATLVKLTWHGPHRTPEQTAEKLKYGYDSLEEHDPQKFLDQIKASGFAVERHELFECDPETYQWDLIQGCVFRKI